MKKRKIKNQLWKIGLFLLGIPLLMWNCETETIIQPELKSQSGIDAKQLTYDQIENKAIFLKFSEELQKKKSSNIKYRKGPKTVMEDMYNFSIDSTSIYQIQIKNNISYTLRITRPYETLNYFENLIIVHNEDQDIKAYIIKYELQNKITRNNIHNSIEIDAKQAIYPIIYNDTKIAAKSTTNCEIVKEVWCSWKYPHLAHESCFDGSHTYTRTKIVCNYKEFSEGGYTSGGGDGTGTSSSDPADDDPNQIITIPNDCKTCPDEFDDEIVDDEIIPAPDKIDASGLTGKAECVYGKMVDNNNNINWILENFKDGDKPSLFDLKFQMSTTLDDKTNASTSKSGNTFTIKINANTLSDRTSLGLARTIIHEGIHARLREFLHRKGGTLSKEDFPGVYEYYRTKDKNWDHQQMADYYRGTIAQGLEQYDNGQHSDEFYNDMAWEGLANIVDANGIQDQIYTEAWKKLTTTEKNRIKNTITDEKENGNKTCQ